MTKKKNGFYMSRNKVEEIIKNYCFIKNIECINHSNQQHRYTLIKDELEFYIDIYFRIDGKLTVNTLPKIGSNGELSTHLCEIIKENIEYEEVESGSFSTELKNKDFEELEKFLILLEGVSQLSREDKGIHGIISKFKTDFGDSVTLTYYKSTGKMLYQGRLMKLYAIIKSYLVPLNNYISETHMKLTSNQDMVRSHLKINLPNGYSNLEPLMAGFISDSFTLVVANTKLNDYAAWVMPTMRVLEFQIKKVCLDHEIMIDDTKGFKYFDSQNNLQWLFFYDRSLSNFTNVNPNITILSSDVCDILLRCYLFLVRHRHEMFHTTQIVSGIRLVDTPDEALILIQQACKLIEESLTYM